MAAILFCGSLIFSHYGENKGGILLYKYLLAINDVDTAVGYLLNLAALEVVDAFDSLAVYNSLVDTCSVCAVECRHNMNIGTTKRYCAEHSIVKCKSITIAHD